MSKSLRFLPLAAAMSVFIAMAAGPAAAQTAPADHDHAATHGKLALDHGKKWPTDAALRGGMGNIRALLVPQLPAIHAAKLAPAQYAELAGNVEAQVGHIVANCKLEPNADAMLHLVIADLAAGADAMAGKNPSMRPKQGAATVVAALNNYGRYFNDPGFKPVRGGH